MLDSFEDEVESYSLKTISVLKEIEKVFNSECDRSDKVFKIRKLMHKWCDERPTGCGAVDKITIPAHTKMDVYLSELEAHTVY